LPTIIDEMLPARWIVKGPQNFFNQLQGQFGQFVPDMARAAKGDFENHARATVMSVLARLDLVTRDEFDAQQAVLLRTREKVEALEAKLAELEQKPD
jgi:BMFP domain-containing protein YqiC